MYFRLERKLHGERNGRKAKAFLDALINATGKDRQEASERLDALLEKREKARNRPHAETGTGSPSRGANE